MKKRIPRTARFVTVTPDMARKWLGRNTNNYRRPSRRMISRYAADMFALAWTLTGQPIIFDWYGVLLDGQNRLLACIEADTPFETVVVEGVDPAAALNMDEGLKRRLGDHLRRQGEENVDALASTILVGWRYDRGVSISTEVPTRHQSMEWFQQREDHEDRVRAAVSSAKMVGAHIKIPVSSLAVVFLRARDVTENDEWVDEFIQGLADGANLDSDSPILALRNYAFNRAGKDAHLLNDKYLTLAYTIKAWNAYITDQPLKHLSFRRGGRSPEKFPVIRGEG